MTKPTLLALTASLVLASAGGAFAQAAPPVTATPAATAPHAAGAKHAHGRYMRALQTLGLTDAQHAQIKDIVAKEHLANKGTMDPAVRKSNAAALRAQIEAVLTPDQQTRLKAALAAPPSAIPTPAASPAP